MTGLGYDRYNVCACVITGVSEPGNTLWHLAPVHPFDQQQHVMLSIFAICQLLQVSQLHLYITSRHLVCTSIAPLVALACY